nr:Monothiol glutaredoxin [Candidatus Pantoea persica]
MRLLITLFMLAFAQLFLNVAAVASPQAPVNASLHKAEKKSAREDERRKRRPVKTSAPKTYLSAVQKLKLKKQAKVEIASFSRPAGKKKKSAKATRTRYGHQRKTGGADGSASRWRKATWSFSASTAAAPPITLGSISATANLFSRRAPAKIFRSAHCRKITGSATILARVA